LKLIIILLVDFFLSYMRHNCWNDFIIVKK